MPLTRATQGKTKVEMRAKRLMSAAPNATVRSKPAFCDSRVSLPTIELMAPSAPISTKLAMPGISDDQMAALALTPSFFSLIHEGIVITYA